MKFFTQFNWKKAGITALFMLGSAVVRMFSLNLFIVPNKLAPGGVSGIASIINNLASNAGIDNVFTRTGTIMLLINIPLLITAFLLINKRFALLTAAESVLSTIFIDYVFPLLDVTPFTDDLFFAAVAGGVATGIAVALMLKTGGSSGGTDIMGVLARKKFSSASIAWLIFAFDAGITLVGGIVFKDLTLVVYSFVALIIGSKTNDILLSGFASAVAVYIITENKDDVVKEVLNKIKRGATSIKVTGTYTNADKNMLVILLRKRQIGPLKAMVKQVDPKAFMFTSMVSEVIGQGFASKT